MLVLSLTMHIVRYIVRPFLSERKFIKDIVNIQSIPRSSHLLNKRTLNSTNVALFIKKYVLILVMLTMKVFLVS